MIYVCVCTCLGFGYSALCLTQVVLITNALPLTTGSLLFQLLQERYRARCRHLQDCQFERVRSNIEQFANRVVVYGVVYYARIDTHYD
jgi:hypothetical protein